ncbi:hypothetical protein K456DRAFT_36470 [Colletotrichum gloeosporioides 23]|nr:hypothetical protein K456DRAFT_36470 [Colletotrichum gloeosporioides 23]
MLACFPWRGGVAEVRRGRRTASGLAVNVAKSSISNQGPHVSSTGTLFPHARRGEAVCTASRLRAALQGLCGSAARATDSGASECAIHGQYMGLGLLAGERFAVWGRARRHVVVDMGGVASKYRLGRGREQPGDDMLCPTCRCCCCCCRHPTSCLLDAGRYPMSRPVSARAVLPLCVSPCPILSVVWDSTQYPLPEQTKRCGARYQPRQAMDEMAAKRNEAFRFRSDAKALGPGRHGVDSRPKIVCLSSDTARPATCRVMTVRLLRGLVRAELYLERDCGSGVDGLDSWKTARGEEA